ncbi:MAG: AzlC family ABC transporter permease [Streptosporangiales bacterium]|nr:AzlC family ABC transporter permease [Streptosporangiales bacterium]MBO0892157.1 AzlC family ABC transporter permease [Acidothermales bacterium]
MTAGDDTAAARHAVLRNAAAIALTTGAYALSFGAVGVAGGLSVWQTCVLSLLMFSGGSQFAFVGVLGGGGAAGSAVSVALLLGGRNAFYGIRLAPLLGVRGVRRVLAGHFVLDETTAMTVAQGSTPLQRYAFWSTGPMLFAMWNLGTLVGALGAGELADPRVLGMDAAAPAAFLALLWPRLREAGAVPVALAGTAVCLAAVPFVPVGVPILLAAGVAIVAGAVTYRRAS